MAKQEGNEASGTLVCGVSVFERSSKKSFTVDGKNIFLVRKGENFYAVDSQCYHMGGPLYKGDIEDFNGRTCIRCPWHGYCVTIDTGESLYQSIDPYNDSKPPEWRSMGRKQRTHTVSVRDGNIFVTLSDPSEHFESDQYNKLDSSWPDQ